MLLELGQDVLRAEALERVPHKLVERAFRVLPQLPAGGLARDELEPGFEERVERALDGLSDAGSRALRAKRVATVLQSRRNPARAEVVDDVCNRMGDIGGVRPIRRWPTLLG